MSSASSTGSKEQAGVGCALVLNERYFNLTHACPEVSLNFASPCNSNEVVVKGLVHGGPCYLSCQVFSLLG